MTHKEILNFESLFIELQHAIRLHVIERKIQI